MVLVDTPVWSLSLRRRAVDLSVDDGRLTQILYQLIQRGQIQLLGSTRQEVLTGIREESVFQRIQDHLGDFPDVELDKRDYEEAARISNLCRRAGVATSAIDMLMCSVSLRHGWDIFTTDRDFIQYQRIVRVRLLNPIA
jgi:predicted nucleic acid-binding protein